MGKVAAIAVTFLAVFMLRCGSDRGTEPPAQLPDVIYDGQASDEALEVVWPKLGDATVKQELQLTLPQGTVDAAPPPTFTWNQQASRTPHRGLPVQRHAGLDAPAFRFLPPSFGLPVAHAHLPPVTGTVVLLEIRGAKTVRVFTDRDSWTPVDADWQAITGGTARTVEVRLYSAYLNENVIEEGPFVSPAPATFQVAAP